MDRPVSGPAKMAWDRTRLNFPNTNWQLISEGDIGRYELKGGRRLFVELLMLLFNGHVKANDGGLGKLSMQFNDDDGDGMIADVI